MSFLAILAAVASACAAPAGERRVAQPQRPSTTSELRTAPTSSPTVTQATTTTRQRQIAGLPPGDDATVGSITDGDTFRTADGTRVRLIGVDTPERGDCYFSEASRHLETLIPAGSEVRLAYDVERTDRFGRTLAYVYRLDDDLFVNRAMAEDGYALQLTIAPNVSYAEEFRAAVASARDADRGLWSGCAPQNTAPPAPPPPSPSPPPPPPSAAPVAGRCHPSYEGTCIPPDVSDADCAGGSGNGPHYVQETNVRVVGPDDFDLDSDGDGIGCEA